MFSKLKLLTQIGLYALIISIGCWSFYHTLSNPTPFPNEAPHLLTAAVEAEACNLSMLPEASLATRQPFHECAAAFVRFISESRPNGYRTRTYRLFPMLLSIFFLLALPALGMKRRGGCFETDDALFWTALFVIFSPAFSSYGSLFLPLSFQALLFLGLLISFRAYVQWPGYLSAIVIALCISLGISINADMAWVSLLFVPAIAISVGWRRICLYWHTGHFLTFCGVLAASLGSGIYFDLIQPPTLPDFTFPAGCVTLHAYWFALGGFSLIAWVSMIFWCAYHPDKRWAKLFTLIFPLLFISSFGFVRGGGFAVPLVCISPILLAMALSAIPNLRIRIIMGGITLLVLALYVPELNHHPLTREAQRHFARTLIHHTQAQKGTPITTAIRFNDPEWCAFSVWPIRHTRLVSGEAAPHATLSRVDRLLTDQPLPQDARAELLFSRPVTRIETLSLYTTHPVTTPAPTPPKTL